MKDFKDMKEINLDDLDLVAGGLPAGANVSGDTSSQTARTSVGSAAGSAKSIKSAVENSLEATASQTRKTYKAYCPACKKETTFMAFSGARDKCLVCGYTQA